MKNFHSKIFIFIFGLLSLLVFSIFAQAVQAQNLFFGQNHNYSVTMRGNGEAVVYARLVVTNTEEQNKTKLHFEIPDASITEIVAFQQILEPICTQYDYQIPAEPSCISYAPPNPESYLYQYGSYKYQKIQLKQDGNKFEFEIPEPIKSQETGAFIIGYAAKGYVQKTLGLYSFTFKTIKVDQRIGEAQVAVNVDSEFQLKGAKAKVDYAHPEITSSDFGVRSGVSAPSSTLDQISRQAGTSGALLKEATALAPGDTFEVKGLFAGNWLLLYLKELILSLLIVAALVFLAVFLNRFMRRKNNSQKSDAPKIEKVADSRLAGLSIAKLPGTQIAYLLYGLLSAATVLFLTVLINSIQDSEWLISRNIDEFTGALLLIILAIAYILALVGAAAWVATKHGARGFISVLLYEMLWLVVFLVLYVALFADKQQPDPPQTVPYYENRLN